MLVANENSILKEVMKSARENGIVPNVVRVSGYNYLVNDVLSEGALNCINSVVNLKRA